MKFVENSEGKMNWNWSYLELDWTPYYDYEEEEWQMIPQ